MSSISAQKNIEARYRKAVEDLAEKAHQDRAVIALILYGSMSYDQVWQGSDLDVWFIMEEGAQKNGPTLVSNGVIVHTSLIPRSRFKRMIEGAQQGGWLDFTFGRSTLLFSKDESIAAWYQNSNHIGERDRDIQLTQAASNALANFAKAKKYCQLKQDYRYAFVWLTYTVDRLAAIEVLLHNEAPGREVIHQALAHNPTFFNAVYADLMDKKKNKKNVAAAIALVDTYLCERTEQLFRPILEYLKEAEGIRTYSEMSDHFAQTKLGGFDWACEWLVDKGYLEKNSAPIHLTKKSRVQLEEPAYYYDAEDAV
jgi:hypothetical protein